MARARTVDPTITDADKAAMRTNRTVKRMGKLSSHAIATDEALRTQRLARAKAVVDAVVAGSDKSSTTQAPERSEADALLLGRAAKITDEQLVEILFENLPISASQAIERLARFDANAMRAAWKDK